MALYECLAAQRSVELLDTAAERVMLVDVQGLWGGVEITPTG